MAKISMGMVQFEGTQGQLVTTHRTGLTLIRGKDDFIAYFGTKGTAKLTKEEFALIHEELGLHVPEKTDKILNLVAPIADPDDDNDDDNDFTP